MTQYSTPIPANGAQCLQIHRRIGRATGPADETPVQCSCSLVGEIRTRDADFRRLCGFEHVADDILQDATMLVVVEFVQRIDPAQQFDIDAVTIGTMNGAV